jgi:hypothetical protein
VVEALGAVSLRKAQLYPVAGASALSRLEGALGRLAGHKTSVKEVMKTWNEVTLEALREAMKVLAEERLRVLAAGYQAAAPREAGGHRRRWRQAVRDLGDL